ncbi:hypothetical protein EXE46_08705 [Halorubrum sp. GN11_10-6_MGM]|uniref:DUF7827 domain-containing protein n=1 Tax=Halorubrum sp. GN11_10-6_MGM TaxID=2518112 RepID=UPI0010F8A6B8|nr:hypothetical protein [Halorubrum sp. GN11_10-6_MGM]TKX74450.1 hypothetical protein EXE46_08705 [Halorubrum sp. GN11_10-6_MGM]
MDTRLALVAAVLLVGFGAIAAPIAAPAAAQSGSAVGFSEAQTTVTQGDVATIELQLRNTDQATLQIDSANQQYRATLRVRDGNGDGTVSVRANTIRGGSIDDADRFTAGSDADTVDLLTESGMSDTSTVTALDPGRYNLIVSTNKTSVAAVLTVDEPEAGGSHVNVIAPNTPVIGMENDPVTNTSEIDADESTVSTDATGSPLSAARGDRVRTQFGVSGIGGLAELPAPARNLVYATDSAPTADTTHTVQTVPNETVSMRSLTIDYGVDDNVPPRGVHQFSPSDIDVLGVDETGDGFVDRSVGFAIQNIRTSTDGRMTITFDRPVTVSKNHTLLTAYEMRNPDTRGAADVSVTLHGDRSTHRERGTVLYGPAGNGTLGYGVDLRPQTATGDVPTAPLAAVDTTYEPAAGGLVTTVDTDAFATGEYTLDVTVGEAAPPSVPRVSFSESFVIVEPDVEFTNQSVSGTSQLPVTADTNLAPGGSVIIRVTAEAPNGGISQVLNCVATVESDGSLGCEFDLSSSADNFDIEVSILRGESTIAGPTKYN